MAADEDAGGVTTLTGRRLFGIERIFDDSPRPPGRSSAR